MDSWPQLDHAEATEAELRSALLQAIGIGERIQGRIDAALEYLASEPQTDATAALAAILRGAT